MNPFQCDEGGVTAPGSIILWAFPYQGQKNSAFVYEGDRFGGKIRSPEDVRPVHPHNIVASNHHKVHGFDSESEQPQLSFGRNVSFSSRWRYETGMNELKARGRQEKRLEINLTKRIDLILVKSGVGIRGNHNIGPVFAYVGGMNSQIGFFSRMKLMSGRQTMPES